MAKISNEVNLIVALWKEKLDRRVNILSADCVNKRATEFAKREIDGIYFAQNRLTEIISDLEEGKL